MNGDRTLTAAALLAAGLAVGGWFVGHGFARGRAAARFVSVKGVSERPAKADLALWPLRFVATGTDLLTVQAEIARSTTRVFAFLRQNGIDSSAAEVQELQVTDVMANPYGQVRPGTRFILTQTVMVRSTSPETVLAASQRVGELLRAGVVLSSEQYGGGGPTFLFTGLNALKPTMIAEATASAREAAEQFARDSRSRLGGIRQANQGVFVILPRDQAPGVSEGGQIFKTVRVVTTVEYFLKN